MFDFETALAGIEYKMRQLMDENTRLKEDALRQRERQEEQAETIQNLKEEISKLTEINKILKLRNALEQKGDSTEVKLKINQYIRLIDKMIASLQSEQ